MRLKKKMIRTITLISDFIYHWGHKQRALRILKTLEEQLSWKLTRSLKKDITQYSIKKFGSRKYRYWLWVYTAYNMEFKEGWIPDNYFGKIFLKNVNNSYTGLSVMRTLQKQILYSSRFPDAYYILRGLLYNSSMKETSWESFFQEVEMGKVFYIKSNLSSQGNGIKKIHKENLKQFEFSGFIDSVIQNEVIQHDWFEKIMPNSLVTIRITTTKDKNGRISFGAATLRLGRFQDQFIKSDSSIRVAIIDMDGTLDKHGIDSNWFFLNKHPDTNFEFYNQKVPFFSKAVEVCLESHRKIPHISVIGFDVAIDRFGEVFILEFNSGHTDIKFHEASTGPFLMNII